MIASFGRLASTAVITAFVLPGCGASQAAVSGLPSSQAALSVSRMRPSSPENDLLYVTRATPTGGGEVDILSYPQGSPQGTITGFQSAGFACSDSKGNVFITDYLAGNIVEYAHGGTSPIATLSDPGFLPGGCSVDPTTGNLAVANPDGMGSQYFHGSVAVYQNAQGSPTIYTDPDIYWYTYCAYDDNGNLFVDGDIPEGNGLAELPKGGSALETISGGVNAGGALEWDGTYLTAVAVLSQGHHGPVTVERINVSGTTGTVVGKTSLYNTGKIDRRPSFVGQYWIQGSTIVGAINKKQMLGFWHYPAGGKPTHVVKQVTNVYSAAVSVAPTR